MNERIDHAAEAERLAVLAGFTYGTIDTRNGDMAVAQQIEAQTLATTAQVHATLALVEQQRIANLIAIMALEIQEDYPLAQSEGTASLYAAGALRPEIAAALRLAGSAS